MKRHLIKDFKLDERLFWGELEDMQFSKISYLNGLLINIDPNNYFISRQVRHIPRAEGWFRIKIYEKYLWYINLIKSMIKNRRIVRMYYKKAT